MTISVSGEQADDGLYIPAIEAARKSLTGKQGMLYVGDTKMEAIATRCHIARLGASYLMPLSKKQVNDETMLAYLNQLEALPQEQRGLEEVIIVDEQGQEQVIAEGFTITQLQQETAQANEAQPRHEWTERRFIVRSAEYAQKQHKQLAQRLQKTEQALGQLVKRRQGYQYPKSEPKLAKKVSRILVTQGCAAYLKVDITEEIESK